MSKYFDETQRAEEWLSREGFNNSRQDISTVLENIRKPDPGEPELPQARLPRSRTVQISPTSDCPIVVGGSESYQYVTEAYRALRTRLMRLQASKGFRSVVISSAAPGEGKTVTTLNLGLCYAQLPDAPVLVIDADLRSRRLSQLLSSSPGPGLAEVLSGDATSEDAILPTSNPNLCVLGAGSMTVSAPELLSGQAWKGLIGKCSETFKLILVDAPPVRPLADFELITAGCDAFLMVVRAYRTQREALQQLAGQIDPKKLAGVVLNSTHVYSKKGYSNPYAYQGQP